MGHQGSGDRATAATGTCGGIVRGMEGVEGPSRSPPPPSPPPPPPTTTTTTTRRVNSTTICAKISAASVMAEEHPHVELQGPRKALANNPFTTKTAAANSQVKSRLTFPRQAALTQQQGRPVTLLDVGSSGKADLNPPGAPRLSYHLNLRLISLTLCLWIKPHRLHQINNVVYAGDARRRQFLQLSLNRGEVTVHVARCHHKFGVFLGVREWHYFCLALGRDSTLYHSGEAVPSSSSCTIDSGDDFLIEKFIIGGSLWGGVPFSGFLADVKLYDALLTEDQVRSLAEGRQASRSVFTVDEFLLQNVSSSAENVEFGTVNVKNLTSEPKDYYFYFEEKVNFIDGSRICKKIGGTQIIVGKNNTQKILAALLKYSGKVEDVVGDSWVLVPEAPGNKIDPSCPLVWAYQNPSILQEEDGDCESTASVLCQLPMDHKLRLLGLEKEVTLYPIYNSLNIFEDGGNYRLIATKAGVQLENVHSGKILYKRVSSSMMQLTGRHKWSFLDNIENNNHNESEVFLTLTACMEGQFTCSDGNCVPLEDVCNLVNDCQDASDELLFTDRTSFSNTYSKRFSPSQGTKNQSLVGFRVILEQVNHIELTENVLKVVLRLDVMWRDPRIVFKYLKKDVTILLPEEAVKEMWLPSIELITASPDYKDRADFPNMKDKIMTATARTHGLNTVIGHSEVKAFPGALTDLQVGRADEIVFMCRLDLFYYPFDVQVCKIPLRLLDQVKDATWNATQLSAAIGKHLTLTLLYVMQFTVKLDSDQETAMVMVKLGRRYDAYFINTMLPCMLLEVIGFLTHAFPIHDFSNRCTATLSCLIVKAAFFLQISGTLPKSADPKLVDVWMFGNVFVLSLVFLAHVAVLHVQQRCENSKSKSKKDCVAWDEEIIQKGNKYQLAHYVNLMGLAVSMLVCACLLSGIGVAATRGKMVAMRI